MVADFKEKTHIKQSLPKWRLILTGLNLLALALSIILSWHYLAGGQMVGCGGGSPCDKVLNSQWSVIAGMIPVSSLAVGAYFALLVAGFYIGTTTETAIRRMAWSVILILVGSIAGSAIWFTILQKWFIGAFCPYCMTTHITGFLLSVLVIWRATREIGNNIKEGSKKGTGKVKNISQDTKIYLIRPLYIVGLVFIGLVITGMLAVYQINFTPSALYSKSESQYKLPTIDYHSVPMVGSPDAPYIVTLLFDYQCSHCQRMHFMLDEAIRTYKGKLAFALCPTPLNTQCNPYVTGNAEAFKNSCELAKIGLAVWLAHREAFPAFESWMFTFESGDLWRPRNLRTAKEKAVELVGQLKLDEALANPWIEQYMQKCIQIYGQTIVNGKGGVPKLIFKSGWVIPEPINAEDLIRILQKSLGVPMP
jgi:uncharacterized membrane protein